MIYLKNNNNNNLKQIFNILIFGKSIIDIQAINSSFNNNFVTRYDNMFFFKQQIIVQYINYLKKK